MQIFSCRAALQLCAVTIVGAVASVSASAQDEGVTDDGLAQLAQCRSLEDDEERLKCYDDKAAQLIDGQESGDITIVKKEDIEATRRSLFGFTTPKTGVFAAKDEDADKRLQSRITSIRRVRSDYWEITIEEGSVWRAADTPRRFRPEVGDAVELERASLGSFWLRVDGARGVKARRIR